MEIKSKSQSKSFAIVRLSQLCAKDVAKRKKFHEQSVRAGKDKDLASLESDNHDSWLNLGIPIADHQLRLILITESQRPQHRRSISFISDHSAKGVLSEKY